MPPVTARHRAEAMAQVMATHDAPIPDLSAATPAMLRTCAGYLAQLNADAELQREYREARQRGEGVRFTELRGGFVVDADDRKAA